MKLKVLAAMAFLMLTVAATAQRGPGPRAVPKFEPDPFWPKALPNKWMMGQVGGTYVDSKDHLWVTTRPRSLDDHDKYAASSKADCCIAPPPILEFDQAGNVVQGWGGPGPGYEWPDLEHGIFVDYKENVWITGNGGKDTNILKFTRNGKFLLQIGHHGKSGGNNDTENLNRPAGIVVYPKTNEVLVADGYNNNRDSLEVVGFFGGYGGHGAGQFFHVHSIASDSKGNIYLGESFGARVLKWAAK